MSVSLYLVLMGATFAGLGLVLRRPSGSPLGSPGMQSLTASGRLLGPVFLYGALTALGLGLLTGLVTAVARLFG